MSLIWNSVSSAKVIVLNKCTVEGDKHKWLPEKFERFDYKIDTIKKTVTSVVVYTDKEIKRNNNKIKKTNIETYKIKYLDEEFVVANEKTRLGNEFEYTINLRNKIVEIMGSELSGFNLFTRHVCR